MTKVQAKKILKGLHYTADEIADLVTRAGLRRERITLSDGRTLRYVGITGQWEISTINPSWTLSRYVRAAIVCNNLPIAAETATASLIVEIAGNVDVIGYDTNVVREILLDTEITAPYPKFSPVKYAGR